jgi:hypothetical protein
MATTNALVIASTVDSLIGGFRSHLLGRSLPAPAYVQLDLYQRRVSVQITSGTLGLADELANLLLWAHTLTDVTAHWWRTSDDRLHINVDGRTSGGLRMHLYTGGGFAETHELVRLAPDENDSVSLDELYTLAGLLREARSQGVA